jgi:hypothetical protein
MMVTEILFTFFRTDCGYSPHAEFVYTGTSTKSKSGESGSLLFFNSESLELVYRIDYTSQVNSYLGFFLTHTVFFSISGLHSRVVASEDQSNLGGA